jgi:hypothetical protein
MRRRANNYKQRKHQQHQQQQRRRSDQNISNLITMPSSSKKESNSNLNIREQSFGITQRRGPGNNTIAVTPIGAETDDSSPPTPNSPNSPTIPTVFDFMIHDDEYGRLSSTFYEKQKTSNSYEYSHQSSHASNLACAKFCTYFSFIAILFLVMIGIMIEVQPLYIKGISAERVPMSFRRMREEGNMGENELLSYVHYSGRLRMLQSFYIHQPSSSLTSSSSASSSFSQQNEENNPPSTTSPASINTKTYDDDPITQYTKYNEYLRTLSDQQKEYIIYEMKSEAKTSFKAAALYFVVMVFCIIYTHNFERVHLMVGLSFNVWWRRIKYFLFSGGLKTYLVAMYHNYRRREYRDIPERNNYSGSGDGVNINMKTANTKNSPIKSRPLGDHLSSSKRGVFDESSHSLRDLGDSSASVGSHFEQQGKQPQKQKRLERNQHSILDMDHKPKKK